MSKLVETIYRLMAEHRPPLQQMDAAQRAGLSPSHLSHILTGKQKNVDVADIPRIAKALSSNSRTQAEVIYAYLLDHLPETPATKHIRIEVNSDNLKEEPPPYRIKLAPDVEQALQRIITRIPDDKDMREMILRLAKFL